MKPKKIGLYGGTFDPVHTTHLDIASVAIWQLGLDEVWFLIEEEPRFKIVTTSYGHRRQMLMLATQDSPRLVVDNGIIKKLGKTHDFQSLLTISHHAPRTQFTIITGLDTIQHLDLWQDYEKFLRTADFAIAPRPPLSTNVVDELIRRLGDYAGNFHYTFLDIPLSGASSTKIREQIKSGKIPDNVTKKVLDYIKAKHLYTE